VGHPGIDEEITRSEIDVAIDRGKSLERVERRREQLYDVMLRLEQALAAPGASDRSEWQTDLLAKCDEFGVVLEDHINGTEGQGGLFEDVAERSPRLISRVDRLRAEHESLQQAAERLRSALLSGPFTDAELDSARAAGLALLGELARHRQHGADLLHEAYWVDVGEHGD